MKQPRRFPTLKRLLFQIHQDLQKIIVPYGFYGQDDLSDLETMIILLEDRRFFEHSRIDYTSLIREILKMVTFRCAPKARVTSGGGFRPESCRLIW